VDAEAAALAAKYGAGFDAEGFDIGDADPVLVARLVALGVDIAAPESIEVIAALTKDPADEFSLWRVGHLPRTAEWRAGRDNLGRPLAEAAEVEAKVAAGWRYHDFAWHPPVGAGD